MDIPAETAAKSLKFPSVVCGERAVREKGRLCSCVLVLTKTLFIIWRIY